MPRANIPEDGRRRLVIIGGGFAGLRLARLMRRSPYRIILLDRNNYHQFQPLLYQVATSGLEPSAIAFPFRKVFQGVGNVSVRICDVISVDPEEKTVTTSIGKIRFDLLVLAQGVNTNFFGNGELARHALPMKSVSEALLIRNTLLQNMEEALVATDLDRREALMNILVVGGGPTGVEVSGTLAEMKKVILPKDFPELSFSEMKIYLLEASDRLLSGMSGIASSRALGFLGKLGVEVRLGTLVRNYNGEYAELGNGERLYAKTLIWAAGVRGEPLPGLEKAAYVRNQRIRVNEYLEVSGYQDIFAIGDIAFLSGSESPDGHPQVAQVALQQAGNLARNLRTGRTRWRPFTYRDKGSMATIGRHMAVVDLPFLKFQGAFAWFVWLFVHLMSIVGVKNRLFIFLNWCWSYLTFDQSLRLILRVPDKNRHT